MENAYSNSHQLALHKAFVVYERASGRPMHWQVNSKGVVDGPAHLVNFLLECLGAQHYVVTEEGVLYQPVLSPGGIPYHKELGPMLGHLWKPLRTFYSYLKNLNVDQAQLPAEENYLRAIDHLFAKPIIATACAVIQGGSSRVRMVQRNYHLRAFRNVLVDLRESTVYTPWQARETDLFAYHYLDLDYY